ncbi:cytochrome P450 [Streptomyces sp. NPDC050504]|uniref:cytochrome P450 n=1 Tax=Streptomyces sp. NPDC050504 TaxID=3365618 RepID=UPI0037A43CC5
MAATLPLTPGRVRAPGALPLLGHAVSMLKDPFSFLTRLPDHGDLVEIRMGPFPATVVTSAQLARQVLLDDKTFDKGGPIYDRGREVLGNGVVTCPHQDHRRLRRLAQPAFTPARHEAYARVMCEQIARVTGAWTPGKPVDVLEDTMDIATRTAVAVLFSGHLSSPALAETLHDFATVMEGIYWRSVTPPPLDRLPTPGKRRYDRSRARLRATIDGVIQDYRRTGRDHHDLLSLLLATSGETLSDRELNDAAVTFFVAATDTTAITVSWALHRISLDPETEQALHTEVDAVLAGRPARHDDLEKLVVTDRIVTETLRLYPPVWILTRKVTRDTLLGGHPLRAGTNLVVSPYVIQHRADLYPDPERFDPARWEGKRSVRVRKQVQDEIIPFGAGARKCMGDVFAMTEATLALATIASRWRMEATDPAAVHPALSALLGPRGLILRALPRTQGLP